MNNRLLIPLMSCMGVLAFLSFASTAAAKNKASIIDVAIGKEKENLELSFSIQNCFTSKMEEAIRSGVATTFRIRVILEKRGFFLARSRPVDLVLEHTIKYDRLKNEYHVQLSGNPHKRWTTADFEEAKLWMSRVEELALIPLWRLQHHQTYQLRVKAELSKVRLPLSLRYIFYFVSLWDFETDWFKVAVTL